MNAVRSWLGSVRSRVTVGITALFAFVMLFGGWFLLEQAEAAWIDDLQARDTAELEAIARDLEAFDTMIAGEFFLPVGASGGSLTLIDEGGNLVAGSPDVLFASGVIVDTLIPANDLGGLPTEAPPFGFGSQPLIGEVTTVSIPVELAQGTLTLTASSSLQPVQSGVDALRDILLIVIPLLVVGVGVMTWFVTGRAFRPVAAITGQVERITDDRLDERVPVPASRDEVAHLARTMNTMLDRLRASRRRQRQFVSDASHELRNPVATSKVKLEVALAHPEETDWDETARVVLAEQERLGNLVDDLLVLATLEEDQPSRQRLVDLDDIVFAEATRPHPVEIDVSGVEAVRVRGDGGQLTRLVRNLVDNAVRHADRAVGVSLRAEGAEAILAVEDDGPGIPEPDRERVFERFVRLEDARTRDEGGAGLGLALVSEVAAAHGGTVRATEADDGGARFEVRIPQSDET